MSSSPPTEPERTVTLAALLNAADRGDLTDWRPIPDEAGWPLLLVVRPEVALVPGRTLLLGQPATAYRAEPTAAAPTGTLIWLQHAEITLIEIDGPTLPADATAALGPPAASLPSGFGPAFRQLLWPDRGLIVHLAPSTGRVARIYGHHLTPLAQLSSSPLVRMRIERQLRPPGE
jgi:hypothetical protein